jgi:hypothetical protein
LKGPRGFEGFFDESLVEEVGSFNSVPVGAPKQAGVRTFQCTPYYKNIRIYNAKGDKAGLSLRLPTGAD